MTCRIIYQRYDVCQADAAAEHCSDLPSKLTTAHVGGNEVCCHLTAICVVADAVEDVLLPADASGACVISLASPATESVDSCSGGGRSGRLGTPPDFVLPTLKVLNHKQHAAV